MKNKLKKYVPGWVDGWVDVKAILKIAYSNQKCKKIPKNSSDGSEHKDDNDDDSNNDSDAHPACRFFLISGFIWNILILILFGVVQWSLGDELQVKVIPEETRTVKTFCNAKIAL